MIAEGSKAVVSECIFVRPSSIDGREHKNAGKARGRTGIGEGDFSAWDFAERGNHFFLRSLFTCEASVVLPL